MNIILECEVTLSKKLEAICEQGEPISILISSVTGNRGRAQVRLTCKEGTKDEDIAKIGETSIQYKVVQASEDVKSLGDVSRFSNLISSTGGGLPPSTEAAVARTTPDVPEGEPYIMRKQPASPMEAVAGNPEAIKALKALFAAAGMSFPQVTQNGQAQQTTQPVTQPQRPPAVRDNSVRSYDELVSEITALPGIDQDVKLPTDRKLTRGEADGLLARMPRLRRKAFVRNNMQSQLLVGDLYTSLDGAGPCMALLPGQAFDLTRLPAKNILNSNDFRWCIETAKLTFVNAADYAASFKHVNDEAEKWSKSDLKVYGGESARTSPHDPSGGVAETLATGSAMMDDGSEIRIGPSGPDPISLNVESSQRENEAPPSVPYEESPEMQMLIGQMPATKAAPPASGPRRIWH